MKQYYQPIPEPVVVSSVLAELNRLVELNHIEEHRLHCSYLPESQDWCFGSNFEEGWDSLIYRADEEKWVWRHPWDGSDEDVEPECQTATELVSALLLQFVDPMDFVH